jgi:DNA-binding NarL/FixJ family response regulator
LLVDDHPVVLVGLKQQLAAARDISIVGEAGSVSEAVTLAEHLKPDLALLDVHLPDGSGVQACRRMLAAVPGLRVLIMSIHDDPLIVRAAISAGAHGYVMKEAPAGVWRYAIRAVLSGSSFLHPRLVGAVLQDLREKGETSPQRRLDNLSPQERRILPLVAEGKTNKEIGFHLSLSEKTVKNYVANMFTKLHVTRRSSAAALYMRDRRRDLQIAGHWS